MRLAVGSTLGPYEITGPIGAGGMGEVYRARDTRLGREVAIKVLPHDFARDPQRAERFEREARSASALNHPGIVTVHEFASHAGEAYLVMELVLGESLRDMLARGPVPRRKLFAIAAGIGDALAAAHAAGIVHRDLKPENVMVTGDGTPKILDFGLVTQTVAAGDLTRSVALPQVSQAGSVLGTLSYMSPEQARGEPVDFRSDQFSLGLILHEMATGRHPFQRATPYETLAAILNEDPAPTDASLPEPFVWIIDRSLAKNRSDRYGSTTDLAHDLARLRDRATSAAVPPMKGRPPGMPRTWWTAAAAAAVVVAALAVANSMRQPASSAIGDPMQFSVATPEIAEIHAGGIANSIVISPDGRYLAIYGADSSGTSHLWLHDLRSGATRLIAEKGFAAAWSPDSRSIAYFAEQKLKTVSVDGGPARVVCDARPEGTPVWQGDTILFAQYSENPGIYRVSAGDGTPAQIVSMDGQGPPRKWWPEFMPDGKHFLYLQFSPSDEVWMGSLDGAAPRRIAEMRSRAVFADGHLFFVRDGTLLAQPFDPEPPRFTGDAKPIVQEVHYSSSTGLASFSVSRTGLLAWRSITNPTRLVWLDRSGMETGSLGHARAMPDGRLSPDGKRYAVGVMDPKQGTSDIWNYDLVRGSQDRMTFQVHDERNPVWGPGGSIYFRSTGGGGPPDIFKLVAGQDGREIVHQSPGVDEPHDVSPDGRWLLFITYTPPVGADIHALPLRETGPPRPFAATPFTELSPRFSPDGRSVAYSSDVSGRPEIYVRPFEGSAPPLRISQAGGARPRWSRDGKELFFLAPGGRLMTVPAATGFGVPRLLFQATDAVDFDVSVDGTRFLVQLMERSHVPPVNVLVNWRARLQGVE